MSLKLPIFLLAAICTATLSPLRAGAPAPASAEAQKRDRWVFSLLPKSLQSNPRLDLTVVTEVSDEGKKLPEPSPAHPVYFEPFSSGYRAIGAMRGTKPTQSGEEIKNLMFRSLASNGYKPADKTHPPSLLIIYTWGIHSLPMEVDEENPSVSPNELAANILDRAALVGGTKFSNELAKLFNETNDQYRLRMKPQFDESSGLSEANSAATEPLTMTAMDLFRRRSLDNEYLLDQASSDVYYVVATAYDYSSVQKGNRVLLWRTRMTVASNGVSQEQALPTVIVSAGPFFGKETTEPQILSKRAVRDGHAIIGAPTLVEAVDKIPAPPPATK